MTFFSKLKFALCKTSEKISASIAGKKTNKNFVREIEEALILADVGVEMAAQLASKISQKKFSKEASKLEIKQFLAQEIANLLKPYEYDFFGKVLSHSLYIILVIGVNGNGKTTTIAKIANVFKNLGHNPLMIAADTFRAAAAEQLKYWADKIQVSFCSAEEKCDPAGLVYNSIEKARQNNNNIALIDTAGRMQNRNDLLAELEKIKKVIKKLDSSAPHSTILILDGLTGQAAHAQIKVFLEKIGVDGIIVTKLDGTAKGGAIISLTQKYKIPIFGLGVGEAIDDLKPFLAEEYAKAIVGV
ncbi:MAG: signal recognition particle-docking protein FtsY [Holosporaceae bacterium]|jgi:fused signal recognition particle receptor|nr:signal recognition particle-docking protein FtsY [Holosporaceae bacterium]